MTKLNEANAYIGVGDGVTAPAHAQSGLVGGNTLYKPMDTGYPTWDAATESLDYRALFLDTYAEFTWAEAVLANGDTGVCLGRLIFDLALTKPSGVVWAVDYLVHPA